MTRESHHKERPKIKSRERSRPDSHELAQSVSPNGVFIGDQQKPSELKNFSPLKFAAAAKLANEAASLVKRGQFSRAAKLWLMAFERSPTVLKYLDEAIYCYGLAGHFYGIARLLSIWETYSPRPSHRLSKLAPRMSRFMMIRQVEEVELEELINLAISILLKNQLPVLPELFNLSLVEDGESQWFHYGVPVSGLSVDEIVELDLELVDRLTQANLPIKLAGYFVTLFEAFGVE